MERPQAAPPLPRLPQRGRLRGRCRAASRARTPAPTSTASRRGGAARHDLRREGDPFRPRANPGREALARRGFPYHDVTPADYVAEHGADMAGFTYDDESYADAELDAWIVEVGELLREQRDGGTKPKPDPEAPPDKPKPPRKPQPPSPRPPPSHAPSRKPKPKPTTDG